MGNRRFIKMAKVIKLVRTFLVLPSFRSNPILIRDFPSFILNGSGCIDITILFLSSCNLRNYLVQIFNQFGVRMKHQAVGCGFNGFINIRIVKRVIRTKIPLSLRAGQLKIFKPAGLFYLLENVGDGHLYIRINSFLPEIIFKINCCQLRGLNPIIFFNSRTFGLKPAEPGQ